jgi:hypothetical protein
LFLRMFMKINFAYFIAHTSLGAGQPWNVNE